MGRTPPFCSTYNILFPGVDSKEELYLTNFMNSLFWEMDIQFLPQI